MQAFGTTINLFGTKTMEIGTNPDSNFSFRFSSGYTMFFFLLRLCILQEGCGVLFQWKLFAIWSPCSHGSIQFFRIQENKDVALVRFISSR